jgi:hypothetical protein
LADTQSELKKDGEKIISIVDVTNIAVQYSMVEDECTF